MKKQGNNAKSWHAMALEPAFKTLAGHPDGLADDEAETRLANNEGIEE